MARKDIQQLAYTAIRIEGGLIPAEELARLTTLNTPDQTEQTERHYGIPKGLKLRDEIARNFKIAQNLWQDFQVLRQRKDVDAYDVTVREFLTPLLRHALGYTDLIAVAGIQATNDAHHSYPLGHAALNGRLPVVMAGYDQSLDQASERFGDKNPDTGRTRRRSPYMLVQEALNASDASLWAVVSNGLTLRILRDNPSLTRPAYIEVDLETIFTEELYADFTAFWLLTHSTRFGESGTEPADCPWERWRHAGQQTGVTVRLNLRYQVADALRSLGTGFLRHPANAGLRARLHDPAEANAAKQVFFEELLSLVYRFIFLATVEDRIDPSSGRSLIFAPDATEEVRERYWTGYSLTWLRERAARRSTLDTHCDLWQALSITFDGLAAGQPALGLPALGGLFASEQCPLLNAAVIDNRYLLTAVFQLGYFRQPTGLTRVNYRDMGAEELGSVYESLLELVPDIQDLSQPHIAKLIFIGDDEEASNKGNVRKLTGSYYTPDSLVQELIKSALEPVIEQKIKGNPSHPVEALLELAVCDPACGSGHFLLAAARRLADEVAKLRASQHGGAPTPADYRHALRDVVGHCIYGVDKNPMAIALAKTALWLEAYTPERPLTFIDHHLRCGDALVGIFSESILNKGIPDKAFEELSGDAKDVCKTLKSTNKENIKAIERHKEKSGFQASLWSSGQSELIELERLPDTNLEEVSSKKKCFSELEAKYLSSRSKAAADMFVAAFSMPKIAENLDATPTSRDLWLLLQDGQHRSSMLESAAKLAEKGQVFHWCFAFPQIWKRGGFDVVLGNPPWDQLVFREQEFFAARAPAIAAAKSASVRSKLIEELRLERPGIYFEYKTSLREADAFRLFVQASGRFPLSGRGRSNTFSLFTELSCNLLNEKGRAGLVLPSGIATDDTTKLLFEAMVNSGALLGLIDFENRLGLFPDVDSRTKFSLATVKGGIGDNVSEDVDSLFVFFAHKIEDVHDQRRHIRIAKSDFPLFNPNTKTAPIFRSRRDFDITKKIYQDCPVFVREGDVHGNTWGANTRPGLFNMSTHSSLFKDERELVDLGCKPHNNSRVCDDAQYLPLYEGKMASHYDHRAADVVISETALLRQGQSEQLSLDEHQNPNRYAAPRHWVSKHDVDGQVGDSWSHKWFLAWKEITSPTNERTLIPVVLPYVGIGHKLPIILISEEYSYLAPCLLASLSSLVVDYVARQKLGTTSLTPFTLKQLPILPPERYSSSDIEFVTARVLELTYTSNDLGAWAADLGYSGKPFSWNPERRAHLRAELDAYYAQLYGLTRDELCYVLDPADVMGEDYPSETFRVLKKNELNEFGEYRTRRLVLEAWDRFEASGWREAPAVASDGVQYSSIGVIQSTEEAKFAGLVAAIVRGCADGVTTAELQSVVARWSVASEQLDATDAQRLAHLLAAADWLQPSEMLNRVLPIVQRLESAGVVVRKRAGSESRFFRGEAALPADVAQLDEHDELARLLLAAELRRLAAAADNVNAQGESQRAQGM